VLRARRLTRRTGVEGLRGRSDIGLRTSSDGLFVDRDPNEACTQYLNGLDREPRTPVRSTRTVPRTVLRGRGNCPHQRMSTSLRVKSGMPVASKAYASLSHDRRADAWNFRAIACRNVRNRACGFVWPRRNSERRGQPAVIDGSPTADRDSSHLRFKDIEDAIVSGTAKRSDCASCARRNAARMVRLAALIVSALLRFCLESFRALGLP
jgi:hypothetical protein